MFLSSSLKPPLEDDDDFEWATEDVEEEEDASDVEEEVVDAVESEEETQVEEEIVVSDPTTTEAPPEPLAVNPARLLTPGKRYVSSIHIHTLISMYLT